MAAFSGLVVLFAKSVFGADAKEGNEPVNVAVTVKEIARIKGLSEDEVAKQIFINAKELFRL